MYAGPESAEELNTHTTMHTHKLLTTVASCYEKKNPGGNYLWRSQIYWQQANPLGCKTKLYK